MRDPQSDPDAVIGEGVEAGSGHYAAVAWRLANIVLLRTGPELYARCGARHAQVNYLSPSLSLSAAGLPFFVAQPPLPLQEFFPAQPLSLFLQPPLPLQEFLPLQS